MLDEVEHVVPTGRVTGPVSDGLAVDVLDRLDGRVCLHIPIIGSAGHIRPDHPHRGAFGVGAQHSDRANAHSHVGAARRDGRFDLAISSVDHVEVDSVLREDAGRLAELRWRRLPSPALGGGELEQVRRRCLRRCRGQHGNHRGYADDNVHISRLLHRCSVLRWRSFARGRDHISSARRASGGVDCAHGSCNSISTLQAYAIPCVA